VTYFRQTARKRSNSTSNNSPNKKPRTSLNDIPISYNDAELSSYMEDLDKNINSLKTWVANVNATPKQRSMMDGRINRTRNILKLYYLFNVN
jgi:hypothetical protein